MKNVRFLNATSPKENQILQELKKKKKNVRYYYTAIINRDTTCLTCAFLLLSSLLTLGIPNYIDKIHLNSSS